MATPIPPKELQKGALAAITGDNLARLEQLLHDSPGLALNPRLINEAALHGNIQAVEHLLVDGADPDAVAASHENYRPLHRAIEHRGIQENPGHRQIVEALLKAGASLTARATWMQLTPLALAGKMGNRELVDLLYKTGAPSDPFSAAIAGDLPALAAFLARGFAASKPDSNNMTLLHYAALSGMRGEPLGEIATLLLAHGADGDAASDIGPYKALPPLHFAAANANGVAAVLLAHGCDPNGGFGSTLWREPEEMAGLFIAHGADVNLREPSGETLLHSRIRWNLPSVVLWLLEKGADPRLTDSHGNTPLHEAASRGINAKVVLALLDRGAEKDALNGEGQKALDIALAKGRTKLLPLLR